MSETENDNKQNYDFDLILDIPLEVKAELGRSKMLVNDLLQLGQGSILELDRKIGEQIDIYVSEKLLARGEVVVVDEKFFRPAEVDILLGDSTKARKVLGWKYERTFEDLVREMVRFDLESAAREA